MSSSLTGWHPTNQPRTCARFVAAHAEFQGKWPHGLHQFKQGEKNQEQSASETRGGKNKELWILERPSQYRLLTHDLLSYEYSLWSSKPTKGRVAWDIRLTSDALHSEILNVVTIVGMQPAKVGKNNKKERASQPTCIFEKGEEQARKQTLLAPSQPQNHLLQIHHC